MITISQVTKAIIVIFFAAILGTIIVLIYQWFAFKKLKKKIPINSIKFKQELNKQQEVKNVRKKKKEERRNYKNEPRGETTDRIPGDKTEISDNRPGDSSNQRRERIIEGVGNGDESEKQFGRKRIPFSDTKDIELHDPTTL